MVALKSNTKMVITASAVPPRLILSSIKKYGVTILCINPILLSLLCNEVKRKFYDVSCLQKVYVSGAILNDAIYEKAKNALTDISVFNVYGLSETAPRVTAQTSACCKSNSVGKPIKGVEVTITNESGAPVSNGERGIIHVKTPSMFSGYVIGGKKHSSSNNQFVNPWCDEYYIRESMRYNQGHFVHPLTVYGVKNGQAYCEFFSLTRGMILIEVPMDDLRQA